MSKFYIFLSSLILIFQSCSNQDKISQSTNEISQSAILEQNSIPTLSNRPSLFDIPQNSENAVIVLDDYLCSGVVVADDLVLTSSECRTSFSFFRLRNNTGIHRFEMVSVESPQPNSPRSISSNIAMLKFTPPLSNVKPIQVDTFTFPEDLVNLRAQMGGYSIVIEYFWLVDKISYLTRIRDSYYMRPTARFTRLEDTDTEELLQFGHLNRNLVGGFGTYGSPLLWQKKASRSNQIFVVGTNIGVISTTPAYSQSGKHSFASTWVNRKFIRTHLALARKRALEREIDQREASETPSLEELMLAIENGYLGLVRKLIQRGVPVNEIQESSGIGPLHLAVNLRNLNIALELLRVGARPGLPATDGSLDTPMHLAVKKGYGAFVRHMLLNLTDIDHEKEAVQAINQDGDTPLHIAVRNKKVDIVRILVSAVGIDLQQLGPEGLNSIEMADLLRETRGKDAIIDALYRIRQE